MKLRRWLWTAPILGSLSAGFLIHAVNTPDAATAANAGKDVDPKQVVNLPISQVVLFNSGVGYFGRSGEVEGEARVDLQFPETDINDLLKSMTLQDYNGGHISAVSYDSREPVSRTLASFAINLNNQPTLSDILTQARGERVEVVMNTTVTNQPGTLQGTIVGTEMQKVPVGQSQLDTQMLNLSTAEGLRCIKLMDVQRVRFLNPTLESELKRALETLALSHDTQKKAVSIQFSGEGRRKVKVGYVIEAPIWKTSYRLVLDKEAKPYLQGWAVVENPTDEDWNGVKMALVSGRPISFKMDLYNPLYINRPTVEPELFASLRPQTYDGGIAGKKDAVAAKPAAPPALPGGPGGIGGFAGGGGGARRGVTAGGMPTEATAEGRAMRESFGMLADKRFAAEFGAELADRAQLGAAVQSAATASKLGDYFQYVIQHPVSMARQKSALLPIVGEEIEGTRVSIYNQSVQAKHPLLGFKFKNTTKSNLAQGPVTVLEGSTYAGDARIPDTTVNDERLLAYAIDLGTEVIPQVGPGASRITKVKAVKGIVTITRLNRQEQVYKISNKSDTERTLLIEHPNRTNQQFKLVDTPKPSEETAGVFRFETKVAARQSAEFKVKEERDDSQQILLSNSPDDTIRYVMNLTEASEALKGKLKEALTTKGKWDEVRRDLQTVTADIARITADQDRIRKNLRETPEKAEVYQTYLKKLSDQEKELDTLTTKQKTLMADEVKARKSYEEFLANLSD
jgi:hypothetical protein